ncbi:Protein-export membrane protein SecD [Rickettsiales endosymbiont of Paramecium tredecaurelia]|nr:Protein-export membrane protein SecD [Candidatus Sarmatiella mevalonica]
MSSSFLPSTAIHLGLDLRGGSHLLLSVDVDGYFAEAFQNNTDVLKKALRKVGYKNFVTQADCIVFNLRDQTQEKETLNIIKKTLDDVSVEVNDSSVKIFYSQGAIDRITTDLIEQSIEVVRYRVDSSGTKEPLIQRQGQRYILLQMPGEEDPAHLKRILGQTAKLTFNIVEENQSEQGVRGGMFVYDAENPEAKLLVRRKSIMTGESLKNAKVVFDQYNQPVIHFSLDAAGGKLFADATKEHTKKRLAIVLDSKLLSAPVINEPILGGEGTISGNFTLDSANDLVLLLKAGALPAKLTIVEERSIGPSLGEDSIEGGKMAGMVGFALVAIFMIWSYGVLGLFADIALVLALLYMMALMSICDVTLTMPGIAGIILTIGMAVDANVLIYERIKEELKLGRSILYAIQTGFKTAFGTILDSNITTLIVALILYVFGVGTVRGFAVTLSIGIVASMFSAIVITKLFIDVWIKYFKPNEIL